MGKSAGSAPSAPDPNVVSAAQTQANSEAARQTAALNRVNTTTPFGTLTYSNVGAKTLDDVLGDRYAQFQAGTYQPNYGNDQYGKRIVEPWRQDIEERNARQELGASADRWTATSTLSPQAQALVDQLYGSASRAPDTGPYDPGAAYTPIANDGTLDRARVEDSLFQRLNPSLNEQRVGLETRLRNQGHMPGSEAWDNAMRAQTMAETDARLGVTSAAGSEIDRALAARQQGFGEYLGQRQQGWNEYSGQRQITGNEQQSAIQALLALSGAAPGGSGGGAGGGGIGIQPVDVQSLYGNQQAAQQAAYQGRVANASSGNAATAGIAAAGITAAAVIA
jgi:hypothetical protein